MLRKNFLIPSIQKKTFKTDLPVMLPYSGVFSGNPVDLLFSRWLVSPSSFILFGLVFLLSLFPMGLMAQTSFTMTMAFETLFKWLPFVVGTGFLMNLLISFFTMLLGTIAGVLLGLGQISLYSLIRKISWFLTQLFRNSPWLVLLFIVMLTFPFEIEIARFNDLVSPLFF